jgi:hypothetical protein
MFEALFQRRECSFWATNHLKVSRKAGFHHLFILPKSSFGEHKVEFDGHVSDITIWHGRHARSLTWADMHAL